MAKARERSAPPSIVVTCGEPAGIGPELMAMLAQRQRTQPWDARIVIAGDRDVLVERAARIGLAPCYVDHVIGSRETRRDAIEVWHHPIAVPVTPGRLDPANAGSVMAMLRDACDACAMGEFAAMVTGPVQKSVLQDAGHAFMGHTEFLAERTHTPRVVMMLAGAAGTSTLRVALVTTHLALKDVPSAITRVSVDETLAIVAAELEHRFAIHKPRIAVCSLNPHSGEGGHLGREEIEVISPAIAAARESGLDVEGPVPADTIFVPEHARSYDAIVAMYHDQGLPVLKAATFGHGVNVTLGLPFVRTSVDHGTALDLASDDSKARDADPGSLFSAVELAIDLTTCVRGSTRD